MQTLNPIEQRIVDQYLPLVATVPLDDRGRRKWQTAPDIAGKIAAAVLKAGNSASTRSVAAALGISRSALSDFLHGRNTSGIKSPEIAGVIRREGAEPTTRGPGGRRPRKDGGLATTITSKPPAPPTPPAPPANAVMAKKTTHAARNWKMVGDDIQVVQVVTLKYGTPEHAAKMREIMLDLGAPRLAQGAATT